MPIFGQSPEFFALNDIGNGFPFSNHLGSHRPNFVPNVRHSNKPSFNRMPSQMNRQPHFNHNFNHNLNGKAPFLNPNNAMNSSTIQGRSSRPPLPVNSSGLPSPPPPIFAPNDESASPHNANRNQRTWIDRGVNTVPRTTLIQITSTTDPCSKSRLVPSSNQSTVSNAPKCSDSKQRTSLNNEFASNESADTTVIQKFQSKSTPKSSCSNVVGADGIQTTSAGPTLSLDEEYEKKLQEQKRKREEFLRQKEERRKQRSVQLANQHGGMSSPANASNLNKHVTVSHTSPATNFNPNHFNKFNDSQHHSSHLSNNGHFNRSNNNYKNYNQRNNNYNHNVENNKFGYQPRSNNNHNNNQPNYVRPSFKRRFTQQS